MIVENDMRLKDAALAQVEAGPGDAAVEAEEETLCSGSDDEPPCNGCPARTRIPAGWICVPAGHFTMGRTGMPDPELVDDTDDEAPAREVTISKPFLMMRDELGWDLWFEHFVQAPIARPVSAEDRLALSLCGDCVVWEASHGDLATLANMMSAAAGLQPCYTLVNGANRALDFALTNCSGFRLPTEAEWEYAAKASTNSDVVWPCDAAEVPTDIVRYAWHRENPPLGPLLMRDDVLPCGENPWGLRNMLGGVWELTDDVEPGVFGASSEAQVDPSPSGNRNAGGRSIIRGCGLRSDADRCRITNRAHLGEENIDMLDVDSAAWLGGRLVRTLRAAP